MNEDERKRLRDEAIRDTGIANLTPQGQSFWNMCDRYHRLTPDRSFQQTLIELAHLIATKASSDLRLGATITPAGGTALTVEQAQAARYDDARRKIRAAIGRVNLEQQYAPVFNTGDMLMRMENDYGRLSAAAADAETIKHELSGIFPKLFENAQNIVKSAVIIRDFEEAGSQINAYRDWINSLSNKDLKWWKTNRKFTSNAEKLNTNVNAFNDAVNAAKQVPVDRAANRFRAEIERIRDMADTPSNQNILAEARNIFGGKKGQPLKSWENVQLNPTAETVADLKVTELYSLEKARLTAIQIAELMEKLNKGIEESAFEY